MSDNRNILVQHEASNINDNGGNDARASYIISILDENERLQEENAFLKKYLISAKNNSSLKTASILTSVLTWTDEHLFRKFEDIFSKGGFGNVKIAEDFCNCGRPDTHIRPTTPILKKEQVDYGKRFVYSPKPLKSPIPSGRISQGAPDIFVTPDSSTFRPISPATPDQAYQNQQSRKILSPNFGQGQLKPKSPVTFGRITPQNRQNESVSFRTPVMKADVDSSSSMSTGQEKTGQSYVTPRTHQSAWSPNPRAEIENWDSLVYRPPEVIKEINKADNTSFMNKKSGSEGYGSHMETDDSVQSDGTGRIGVPVMTSTPKKGQRVDQFVQREFSILNRPVDPVIGINAIYTDQHRQKLSKIQPNKRIIGEIAFQLDRRILEYVFTLKQGPDNSQNRRRRFYGFSLGNMGKLIRREATDKSGQFNPRKELEMRYRFDYILKTLSKFGYNFEKHSLLSQDLVNKYGLLSGPPERKLAEELGLNDPIILRLLLSQLIKDNKLLEDALILLDCLCLLANEDKKSIFLY